jgi:hypothetical protein
MQPKVQAKSNDMCMGEAMPFQQHYEYRTTLPLADVIHDKFFLPMRTQLYPGDSITLCRVNTATGSRRDSVLSEIATVRVISSSQGAVPLALLSLETIDAPVQEKAA